MTTAVLQAFPATATRTARPCRLCGAGLRHTFVDLGMSPLCESFLASSELDALEPDGKRDPNRKLKDVVILKGRL